MGPVGEQGADEAFGFAVGFWPVGPDPLVLDAEAATGDCVRDGDVGGAVVGEHPLDVDAVTAIEDDCAAQEADRGCRLLVGEHFGVREAAVVVDGDVDVLPAGLAAPPAGSVGVAAGLVLALIVSPALAGAPLDPAELLDVDVHQLARAAAFVATSRLEPCSRNE